MSKSNLTGRAPQRARHGYCLVAVPEDVYVALRATAIMKDVSLGELVRELASR